MIAWIKLAWMIFIDIPARWRGVAAAVLVVIIAMWLGAGYVDKRHDQAITMIRDVRAATIEKIKEVDDKHESQFHDLMEAIQKLDDRQWEMANDVKVIRRHTTKEEDQ